MTRNQVTINALKAEIKKMREDDVLLRKMCLAMEKINHILMPILNQCKCEKSKKLREETKSRLIALKDEYQHMRSRLKTSGNNKESIIINKYLNSLNNNKYEEEEDYTLSDDDNDGNDDNDNDNDAQVNQNIHYDKSNENTSLEMFTHDSFAYDENDDYDNNKVVPVVMDEKGNILNNDSDTSECNGDTTQDFNQIYGNLYLSIKLFSTLIMIFVTLRCFTLTLKQIVF